MEVISKEEEGEFNWEVVHFMKNQKDVIAQNPSEFYYNQPLFVSEDVQPIDLGCIDLSLVKKGEPGAPSSSSLAKGWWRVGIFFSDHPLDTRKMMLFLKLYRFWSNHPQHIQKVLLPIILRKVQVTPALLDYLCVNYSKNPTISYEWTYSTGKSDEKEKKLVNIFKCYSEELDTWHRDCFDPHRRQDRIWFSVVAGGDNNEIYFSTTVAQLHFLHWAWRHGVLHYAQNNIQIIKMEYLNMQNNRKRKRFSKLIIQKNEKKKPCTKKTLEGCEIIHHHNVNLFEFF